MISIITVCRNSEATIKSSIMSVNRQPYDCFEHIFIDGKSTDNTLNIIFKYSSKPIVLSEPDDGIYDAMNKGFKLSSGSIVAFLNSDDFYSNDLSFSEIAKYFEDPQIDFIYGNIIIVNRNLDIIRNWLPDNAITKGRLVSQIPHPSLFVRRSILEKISPVFDPSLKISSDFKQQLILVNILKANGLYLNKTFTVMQNGGTSTSNLLSYINGWSECIRSYNQIMGSGGFIFIVRKIFKKLSQINF